MMIDVAYSHRFDDLCDLPIKELALFVLSQEGCPPGTELSISFIDDAAIAQLNERYRGKQGPTDVLSFECDDIADACTDTERVEVLTLGDIVIAPDVATRQASEFGTTFEEEISLLIVHGILHLCGYDHIQDDEARVMEAREDVILGQWRAYRANDNYSPRDSFCAAPLHGGDISCSIDADETSYA